MHFIYIENSFNIHVQMTATYEYTNTNTNKTEPKNRKKHIQFCRGKNAACANQSCWNAIKGNDNQNYIT